MMLQRLKRLFNVFVILGFSHLPMLASADITASIKPLGFIASAIADGVTPVTILLPDGASEHDFALRPSDIQQLKTTDLVLWVGPELEMFMARAVSTLPADKKLSLAALPSIASYLLKGADHHTEGKSVHKHRHHTNINYHIWLSPVIAKIAAEAIHAKLLKMHPQSKAILDANLQYFEKNLAELVQNIHTQLHDVKNRGYYVFHDAYTYFEQAFGLVPMGHFTVNPNVQPGAKKLHQIRAELLQQRVVCIFAEPQYSPVFIDAVARGTQVRRGVLDPLGSAIQPTKKSYLEFLEQLTEQYILCLKEI